MSNVLSPRDLVFRPDNMDETVPHMAVQLVLCLTMSETPTTGFVMTRLILSVQKNESSTQTDISNGQLSRGAT